MKEKRKIVQYRERLDKTLASTDLTNDEMLKKLVNNQLLCSNSKQDIQGYNKEKLVDAKAADLSNILDMLRSVSVYDNRGSSTPHADWKLKQDNEEFRVMYRKGPEGTPIHTLMVEGFVDGPFDDCLCLLWEASLYKKWWPQFTVPSFKVTASECLQKETEEQISLVRMKLPWPLSMREAVVHYSLFEYFEDDLIAVTLNSVPEQPKRKSGTMNGFNMDAIPEAKDVVRIDLEGGFVLQKVTSERSYLRVMANLDIKLDFVPSSLINFVSRQLIGSGFRLYQKAAASMKNHDKEFRKALGDSLYVRVREALHGKELEQVANNISGEEGDVHEGDKEADPELSTLIGPITSSMAKKLQTMLAIQDPTRLKG